MHTESTRAGLVVRPSVTARCVSMASSRAWPLPASARFVVASYIVATATSAPKLFMRNEASATSASISHAMEGAIFPAGEDSRRPATFLVAVTAAVAIGPIESASRERPRGTSMYRQRRGVALKQEATHVHDQTRRSSGRLTAPLNSTYKGFPVCQAKAIHRAAQAARFTSELNSCSVASPRCGAPRRAFELGADGQTTTGH